MADSHFFGSLFYHVGLTLRGAPGEALFLWQAVSLSGVLFALLWLSELIPATVSGQAPPSQEIAGLIVNPSMSSTCPWSCQA